MNPKNYWRLAAVIFAIIALLQLVHLVSAWDIALNGAAVPLFVSAEWRAVSPSPSPLRSELGALNGFDRVGEVAHAS